VIHGADKHARSLLPVFAPAIVGRRNAIARLLRGTAATTLLEELLLPSSLILPDVGRFLLRSLRLRGRRRLHLLGRILRRTRLLA
jgi:hypothetical protein